MGGGPCLTLIVDALDTCAVGSIERERPQGCHETNKATSHVRMQTETDLECVAYPNSSQQGMGISLSCGCNF